MGAFNASTEGKSWAEVQPADRSGKNREAPFPGLSSAAGRDMDSLATAWSLWSRYSDGRLNGNRTLSVDSFASDRAVDEVDDHWPESLRSVLPRPVTCSVDHRELRDVFGQRADDLLGGGDRCDGVELADRHERRSASTCRSPYSVASARSASGWNPIERRTRSVETSTQAAQRQKLGKSLPRGYCDCAEKAPFPELS